jgi:hypothetical protein
MAAHRSRRHSRIHSHEALAFLPALDTGSGRLGPNGPSLAPVLLRVTIAKPKYLDTPEKGGNGIPAPWPTTIDLPGRNAINIARGRRMMDMAGAVPALGSTA